MKKSKLYEKTISTRSIYKGRIINLREDTVMLPDNGVSKREIVEHPGAVAVIAITRDKKMIFVRQFRKATGEELFEIPAGLVNKGESDKAAAARELEEEAGYRAKKVKEVFGAYSSPGYSSEVIRYLVATDLVKTQAGGDHDEFIEVDILPIKKALALVKKGKIKDNKTIVGIMIAEKWKNI